MNWKGLARRLYRQRIGLRTRMQLWEGLAKERTNARLARELDIVRMDAFTGWLSARLLKAALEEALSVGQFSEQDHIRLQKEIGKVRFEDPEQFKC